MAEAGDILVCFALRDEARPFFARRLPRVEVLITGMGQANAARAVGSRIARRRPGIVLTCGFAGGLNPALARNTVVCDLDPAIGLDAALAAAGAVPGRFHFSDRIVVSAADKRRLRADTGADAVEMESEVIRGLCRQAGIRAGTVRVISDSANDDLPLDLNALLTRRHRIHLGRLLARLLRSPGSVPRLLQLQRRCSSAARRLAEVLHQALAAEAG